MAKVQNSGKKKRLGKAASQTRWAPFWIVTRKLGKGAKTHPSSLTAVKRNWRRTKLRA
jgi:ribosomal protein L39E